MQLWKTTDLLYTHNLMSSQLAAKKLYHMIKKDINFSYTKKVITMIITIKYFMRVLLYQAVTFVLNGIKLGLSSIIYSFSVRQGSVLSAYLFALYLDDLTMTFLFLLRVFV